MGEAGPAGFAPACARYCVWPPRPGSQYDAELASLELELTLELGSKSLNLIADPGPVPLPVGLPRLKRVAGSES